MDGSRLRIAVTLPSAASLGAYEAGAVAALLVAVQRLNAHVPRQPVSIDAVGATSAGALVGLLAVRSLLAGLDPKHVLHTAWVEEASWPRLRSRRGDAPLSLDSVAQGVRGLLDPRDEEGRPVHRAPEQARQRTPVVLRIGLGTLQALAYRVHGVGHDVEAMTHADHSEFVLGRDDGIDAYTEPPRAAPLDVALASMSHPGAFAPRLLDRTRERARYEQQGIQNLPDSGHLWCVDGGAVVQAPLGETLSAALRSEQVYARGSEGEPFSRLHLLVHPHTAGPDEGGRWTDPGRRPRWTASLARVVASYTPEPLFAEHDRIARRNRRLQLGAQLVEAVRPHLPAEAAPALREVLSSAVASEDGDAGDEAGDDVEELMGRLVALVAGGDHDEPVAAEVVSPLRLVDDAGDRPAGGQAAVPQLLAGEFLGRFGGLLDRGVRHSDFVNGWRSTASWLPGAFSRHGLDPAEVDVAVAAMAEQAPDDSQGRGGGTTLSDLPVQARARLVGAILRAARIAVRDALS